MPSIRILSTNYWVMTNIYDLSQIVEVDSGVIWSVNGDQGKYILPKSSWRSNLPLVGTSSLISYMNIKSSHKEITNDRI